MRPPGNPMPRSSDTARIIASERNSGHVRVQRSVLLGFCVKIVFMALVRFAVFARVSWYAVTLCSKVCFDFEHLDVCWATCFPSRLSTQKVSIKRLAWWRLTLLCYRAKTGEWRHRASLPCVATMEKAPRVRLGFCSSVLGRFSP